MENKLVIITAPSGAGKTTIVKHLLNDFDFLAFSVSACTRAQREGEVNGKDYYFISPSEFKQKIQKQEFAEYEEVYENMYYGTLKSEIERLWKQDKVVLFDIDVQGALNLKKIYGNQALTLFIKPPSFQVLAMRLSARKTESPESLKKRLDKAKRELEMSTFFDALVLNDDLNIAINETKDLVLNFVRNYS